MFYSETLLSKTGPLARVWLSANIERKLQKKDVLQSNIESSVNAIVDQAQAPLALRLSGQLLLGVVRIYRRKAGYLLDDCNETLHKIKMTFRSGNVDLPANQLNTANAASLTLPDVLTELDLLAPFPDPSLLLSQPFDDLLDASDPTLLDFDNSQHLRTTPLRRTTRRVSEEPARLDDDFDLNLDLGDDLDMNLPTPRDIEMGRDAPARKSLATDLDETLKLHDGDDLVLDLGEDLDQRRDDTILPDFGDTDLGQDIGMGGFEDVGNFALPEMGDTSEALPRRERGSLSPLSSIRSSAERDLARTVQDDFGNTHHEERDEVVIQQAQRAKRRKVLQLDIETELRANQIRAQQNDRSNILKPATYIPRDPLLLALMNMHKNGEFVSNILGDGRSKGWAPELRGILSMELVATPLKRKRDIASAKQAEAGATETSTAIPQIEIPSEVDRDGLAAMDDLSNGLDMITHDITTNDVPIIAASSPNAQSRAASEVQAEANGVYDDDAGLGPIEDYDASTVAPVIHSAPISLGTKHAVHLLREKFGDAPTSQGTPSKRAKAGVLFQDLLPERTTTRADATKMFFEVLVLATKDAIKVEQAQDVVGASLRVSAKKGLWGAWAERSAGGEIEEEEQQEAGEAQADAGRLESIVDPIAIAA